MSAITVYPRSRGSVQAFQFELAASSQPYGEIIADQTLPRTRAFCMSRACLAKSELKSYRVLGVGLAVEAPTRYRACPRCGHAVFFTRKYKEVRRG